MARTVEEIINDIGFEDTGTCSVADLRLYPEVRAACKANTCGQWDKTWACPPACGELDHFEKLIGEHKTCYVLQTWGELEDEFDFETMQELMTTHNKRTNKLVVEMAKEHPEAMVLGAGPCTLCDTCTYPDEPCRHPEVVHTAMEAAGLNVSETCRAAGVTYNHGKGTLAYESCVIA